MKITEPAWVEYIGRISRLNRKAGEMMAAYIEQHGLGDHDALIRYAYALVLKYGDASAALACQMYDAIAKAEQAAVQAAEPAEAASYGEVAKMVNGTIESPANLKSGVGRLVKRAAADTTLKNAVRDGAEFAWVPHGDTCPFCITLASRGWQKASKKALEGGHAEHIHANCDCEYAIRFNSRTTVAGYDPDKYLQQYENAGGDINAMRRERYAANKDAINAQKRAAYASRKENGLPSKAAGLQDVLSEYLKNAAPGTGSITYDDGYKKSNHAEEIKTARWMHENLGGDIVLLQEKGGLYEKTPDYLWNGKEWELKTTSTEKAADSALRNALKQIAENPGGVIFDYGENEISLSRVMDTIMERLNRQEQCTADILILHKGKLVKAVRYKK